MRSDARARTRTRCFSVTVTSPSARAGPRCPASTRSDDTRAKSRVLLVKSHFRARECRPDTVTGQCVVLGLRLTHPTVVAVRLGRRRGDFLPSDVAPMIFLVAVCSNLIRVLPQHPRGLGVGRRSRGEQGEGGDHQKWTESYHRLSSPQVHRSLHVDRRTLTLSWASHVRRSVQSG